MGETAGRLTDSVGSVSMVFDYELHYDDEQFAINGDSPDSIIQQIFGDLKQNAIAEIKDIPDADDYTFNNTIEQPMAGYTMNVNFTAQSIPLRFTGSKGGSRVENPYEQLDKAFASGWAVVKSRRDNQ
jgi:hypothetical protein